MKLKKKRIVSVMTSDRKELDEDLITSEVCMQCGKCCKTTWIQERYTDSGQDRLDYLQAMFSRSPRSFVEVRPNRPGKPEKVAVCNWCSQLMPNLSCGIYESRPTMCQVYNCFTAANSGKRDPEYFEFIQTLIERVHGTDPYKRRPEETEGASDQGGDLVSQRTDAQADDR